MSTPIYVYATEAELKQFGLSAADKRRSFDSEQFDKALAAASSLADGYLTDGRGYPFTLPLNAPVPPSLAMHVAWIAAYELMTSVGYQPEQGAPDFYRDRYEDALKWLEGVRDGKIHLGGVVDSTPVDEPVDAGVPFVVSATSRGYSSRSMSSTRGGPEISYDMTVPGKEPEDGGGGFVGD